MIKFHPLHTQRLTILNLAGLSSETIIAGNAAGTALGALGTAALNALIAADGTFRVKLITAKTSPLTIQIHELDGERDTDSDEVWRTSNAAAKSSITANAAAGQKLVAFLKPYRDSTSEPLMSQTSTINYMEVQYNADKTLQDAAAVLQLDSVFKDLFYANTRLSALWNERANEDAGKSGPSPSSLRGELERCYDGFCNIIIQTIKLQPSPALETLFQVMNEIRIKYHRSLPIRLTDANTIVDVIPAQPFTGQTVTPIPHVYVKKDDGTSNEIRFTVDYFVTYRNNIDIGEAKIIIHGKGKYAGRYTSTFHII
jgi:hypothetical protein